jgi:hypothetical protein
MFVYSQPSSNNKIEKISDNEYKIWNAEIKFENWDIIIIKNWKKYKLEKLAVLWNTYNAEYLQWFKIENNKVLVTYSNWSECEQKEISINDLNNIIQQLSPNNLKISSWWFWPTIYFSHLW